MTKRNTTQRDKDRAVLKRARAACYICGLPIDYDLPWLDPGAFEAEHVIPLSKGGPDTLANKRPAHRRCNSKKRARHHAPIVRRSGSLG